MRASKPAFEMSNPNDTNHEILELNYGTMELACNPINSEGWQRLNARLGKGLSASKRTEIYSNLWDGKPCNELCLWDEQGYGDTLMAIRWIPAALKRCKDAKIVVRRNLVRLIQERYDMPEYCKLIELEGINHQPWRYAKKHIPMLSLPGILKPADITGYSAKPYLRRTKKKKVITEIGIVWAAGEKKDAEAERMRITRSLP